MLSSCFRRRVGREIAKAINSSNVQELQRKLCQRAKQGCESRWPKMIGKPCAGKLHARLCVQRRLACSAGVNPAGVKGQKPHSLNGREEGNRISEAH
jgi:hypothetical protein